MLEKQFGHKQKKKDEDEVVEEKTLLHSELCEPHEYLVYHHCSEVKGQLTGVSSTMFSSLVFLVFSSCWYLYPLTVNTLVCACSGCHVPSSLPFS